MQKIPSSHTTPSVVKLSITNGELSKLRLDLLQNRDEILAKVLSTEGKGKLKLLIGDLKVSVLTHVDLTPGETIKLKVVKVGQNFQLQIITPSESSSKQTQQAPEAPSVAKNSKALTSTNLIKVISIEHKIAPKVGQQLEAKVISINKSGMVRLQVGDGVIEGYYPKELKVDQKIQVKPIKIQGRLHMQIMPSTSSSIEGVEKSATSTNSTASQLRLMTVDLIKDMRQGDILQAKVITNSIKGEMTLKLGGFVTKVVSDLKPPVGSTIYLRIIKSEGQAILEQISPKEFTEQIKLDALRQVLPRQSPINLGMQKLLDVGANSSADLPKTVKELIVTLVKQQVTPERLNVPSELRHALMNSGLFAEGKLLAGVSLLGDLKIGLNQLMAQIRPVLNNSESATRTGNVDLYRGAQPTPAQATPQTTTTVQLGLLDELWRSSDSVLARIQAQQLVSVPQEDSKQQSWNFEIPILNGDKIERLNIEIDKGNITEEESSKIPWQITLQMNLSPLGEMRVQLKLKDRAISTIFWAEEKETLTLLNQNIATLKNSLDRAGFEINEMRVLHGIIKQKEKHLPKDVSLLNVKV